MKAKQILILLAFYEGIEVSRTQQDLLESEGSRFVSILERVGKYYSEHETSMMQAKKQLDDLKVKAKAKFELILDSI